MSNFPKLGNFDDAALFQMVWNGGLPWTSERDENEIRKPFTTSERVAIAEALRKQISERRGRPSKDKPASDIPENIPELKPGTDTRDAVAALAGFGNSKTMEQASAVVKSGSAKLVAAMDAGEVSVRARLETAPARGRMTGDKNAPVCVTAWPSGQQGKR